MSNTTPDVTLNIATTSVYSSSTTSTNGTTYYYQYTGGNDGNGGIEVSVNNGTDNIQLSLGVYPSTVRIAPDPGGVKFTNSDGTPYAGTDLSWSLKGNSATTGTIKDKSETTGNYEYGVVLSDSSGTQPNTFTCDPSIINKPPA